MIWNKRRGKRLLQENNKWIGRIYQVLDPQFIVLTVPAHNGNSIQLRTFSASAAKFLRDNRLSDHLLNTSLPAFSGVRVWGHWRAATRHPEHSVARNYRLITYSYKFTFAGLRTRMTPRKSGLCFSLNVVRMTHWEAGFLTVTRVHHVVEGDRQPWPWDVKGRTIT